jgi:hypothetical protein
VQKSLHSVSPLRPCSPDQGPVGFSDLLGGKHGGELPIELPGFPQEHDSRRQSVQSVTATNLPIALLTGP